MPAFLSQPKWSQKCCEIACKKVNDHNKTQQPNHLTCHHSSKLLLWQFPKPALLPCLASHPAIHSLAHRILICGWHHGRGHALAGHIISVPNLHSLTSCPFWHYDQHHRSYWTYEEADNALSTCLGPWMPLAQAHYKNRSRMCTHHLQYGWFGVLHGVTWTSHIKFYTRSFHAFCKFVHQ